MYAIRIWQPAFRCCCPNGNALLASIDKYCWFLSRGRQARYPWKYCQDGEVREEYVWGHHDLCLRGPATAAYCKLYLLMDSWHIEYDKTKNCRQQVFILLPLKMIRRSEFTLGKLLLRTFSRLILMCVTSLIQSIWWAEFSVIQGFHVRHDQVRPSWL